MTEADIQAIADLTAKFLGIPFRPIGKIRDVRRGTAWRKARWFSIPRWVLDHGEDYATYYVIHEVCHFANGYIHHGPEFREVEDRALAYWGLKIHRKKVYPAIPWGVVKL